MKAMLDAMGIKSHYTLVRAGERAPLMKKDFPSNQFNHAFLCVPIEKDTLWLECTSQHVPCGYLGTFTDDRDVLLITDEGGKVVHTPVYTAEQNQQWCRGYVKLEDNGNGIARMNNIYKGIYYDDMSGMMLGDDQDKKKRLYDRIDIPSFKIDHYEHEQVKERIPAIKEKLDINLANYATLMGNRIIVPLNLFNKMDPLPRYRNERKSDIYIRHAIVEIDTIEYEIPAGYQIENIPEANAITNEFGEYRFEVIREGNKIIYIRYFQLNKGEYSPAKFSEFESFIESVMVFDDTKAVLVKG